MHLLLDHGNHYLPFPADNPYFEQFGSMVLHIHLTFSPVSVSQSPSECRISIDINRVRGYNADNKNSFDTGYNEVEIKKKLGIPLKIMFPNLKITLLDSLQKRITFLDTVIEILQITRKYFVK